MTDGVIRDQMSSLDDRTRNLWTNLHKSSDQKKRRFDFVPRKDVQESLGMNIIWAIIVGEGEIAGIRTMGQRCPV